MDKNQDQKSAQETQPAPVIVVTGQTASGKSDLAIKIAKEHNGEIICADSRTIYIDMDIGTAKPSVWDQKEVPHHGLDLIEPDQTFSAAAFKEYAMQKVSEIHKLGKLPIIVGGTGLYIDGYIYDYDFAESADEYLRQELSELSLSELQDRAIKLGVDNNSSSFKNPRHLARIIERGGAQVTRQKIRPNTLLLGLKVDKTLLESRINQRVDKMFNEGFIKEVKNLNKLYGVESPGLLAPGYKAANKYISGQIDLNEAKNEFKKNDRQLAKRQMTWFRRNSDINWVESEAQALTVVEKFLNYNSSK